MRKLQGKRETRDEQQEEVNNKDKNNNKEMCISNQQRGKIYRNNVFNQLAPISEISPSTTRTRKMKRHLLEQQQQHCSSGNEESIRADA